MACCHCGCHTMVKLAGGTDGAVSGVVEQPHMERREDVVGWVAKRPMEEHGGSAGQVEAGGLMSSVAWVDCAGAKKAKHVLVLVEGAGIYVCGAVELLDVMTSSGSSRCTGGVNSVAEDGGEVLGVAAAWPELAMGDEDDNMADMALIHIQVLVGQVAMQVVIDTGSGHSFIQEDTLSTIEVLGQQPVLWPWQNRQPLGISGGTLDVVASTVLQLKISSMQAAVQFAIVHSQIPTLIGNNTLQHLGRLRVDYTRQAIEIGGTRVPFEPPTPIYTVDTINKVTLPPMTITLVECQVGGWLPSRLLVNNDMLVSAINPTTLFDPTSGLATA